MEGGKLVRLRLVPWLTEHHSANDRSMQAASSAALSCRDNGSAEGESRAEPDSHQINPSSKRYQCIFQQNARPSRVQPAAPVASDDITYRRRGKLTATTPRRPRATTLYSSYITSFGKFICGMLTAARGFSWNVQHAVLSNTRRRVTYSGRHKITKREHEFRETIPV